MGLTKVFTARDECWYRGFANNESFPDPDNHIKATDAVMPDGVTPRRWGLQSCKRGLFSGFDYSGGLLAGGRSFGEEPFVRYFPGQNGPFYGAIWCGSSDGRWTINVHAKMRQACWPTYNASFWKFDAASGICFYRTPVAAADVRDGDPVTGSVLNIDRIFAEPAVERMWWYGLHATAFHGGAVELNTASFEPTDNVLMPGHFEAPPGEAGALMWIPGNLDNFEAFAIDSTTGRAYVQWSGSRRRQVHVYDRNADRVTWRWVKDLWAPGPVNQILMTDVGLVYLIDANDWLAVYGTDLQPQGMLRHPRRAHYPFGSMYGWDRMYRRLLFLAGTENLASGASTMRVEGLYPYPEAMRLTPPVPLKTPRKGRRITVLAHLAGEGNEPISAANAKLGVDGTETAFATADGHGDLLFPLTPATAGDHALEVTAPWP